MLDKYWDQRNCKFQDSSISFYIFCKRRFGFEQDSRRRINAVYWNRCLFPFAYSKTKGIHHPGPNKIHHIFTIQSIKLRKVDVQKPKVLFDRESPRIGHIPCKKISLLLSRGEWITWYGLSNVGNWMMHVRIRFSHDFNIFPSQTVRHWHLKSSHINL